MARADVSPYVGWNEARATSGACRCRPDYCRHQGGVLVFMPDRISNWLRLPQLFRSYGTITATRFELARDLWRTPRPLPSFRWPRRKRVTASTAKLRSARLLLSEDRYSTPRCCYVGKKREGEIGDRETVLLISLSAARDDRHLRILNRLPCFVAPSVKRRSLGFSGREIRIIAFSWRKFKVPDLRNKIWNLMERTYLRA